MANLLHVSEAAALALHSMALMAGCEDRSAGATTDRNRPGAERRAGRLLQTRQMADRLQASDATLAKVLAELRRARLVQTVRGPRGGMRLARPAEKITLGHIYEAIEGPLRVSRCMFREPVCGKRRCVLSGFLETVSRQVSEKLKATKLSDFAIGLRGSDGS